MYISTQRLAGTQIKVLGLNFALIMDSAEMMDDKTIKNSQDVNACRLCVL